MVSASLLAVDTGPFPESPRGFPVLSVVAGVAGAQGASGFLVELSAQPVPGPNATMRFTVLPSGGYAPYLVRWSFGDGSLLVGTSLNESHAYASNGLDTVAVRVVDADGSSANASLPVKVSGSSAAAPPLCTGAWSDCGPLGLPWGLLGAALGGFGVVLATWWLSRGPRLSGRLRRPSGRSSLEAGGSSSPARPEPVPEAAAAPTGAPPSDPPTRPGVDPSADSLPARVLLHLYAQGVPSPDTTVGNAFTQAGISEALGRPQSAFARALLRLEDSHLVRSELAHVTGRARRTKVYRLTPTGESAARRLRGAGRDPDTERRR